MAFVAQLYHKSTMSIETTIQTPLHVAQLNVGEDATPKAPTLAAHVAKYNGPS